MTLLNTKTIILATSFFAVSAASSSLRPRKLVSNDSTVPIDAAATIDAAADKRILSDDEYSCSFFTTKDIDSVYQFGFEEESSSSSSSNATAVGATSDIGASLWRNIIGLAYSHQDGFIYVADGIITDRQQIKTINPNTGETYYSGPLTEEIISLEFVDAADEGTTNKQLWGFQLWGKIFDLSGSSATELHDTGMSFLRDLAWDASSGILYAIDDFNQLWIVYMDGEFVLEESTTEDPTTTFVFPNNNDLTGIAFHPESNEMYGLVGTTTDVTVVYHINKTTWETTFLGTTDLAYTEGATIACP